MLKIRNSRQKHNLYSKTLPDQLQFVEVRKSIGSEAKEMLHQISLSNDMQLVNIQNQEWSKPRKRIQKIYHRMHTIQQGCLDHKINKVNVNKSYLDKNIIQMNRQRFQRDIQFQKTIMFIKKEQKRKKSCPSVNFIFEKSTDDKRIHSNGFYSLQKKQKTVPINQEIFKQTAKTFQKSLNKLDSISIKFEDKRNIIKRIGYQKKNQRNHSEMIVRRRKRQFKKYSNNPNDKKIQTLLIHSPISASSAFQKEFTFLNSVLKQQRKNLFCPTRINTAIHNRIGNIGNIPT